MGGDRDGNPNVTAKDVIYLCSTWSSEEQGGEKHGQRRFQGFGALWQLNNHNSTRRGGGNSSNQTTTTAPTTAAAAAEQQPPVERGVMTTDDGSPARQAAAQHNASKQ
ncbi:hypothetical protein BVRB_4g095480 [Beta vulgaris subsp. vulgaris]|uniref:Uncharacterized protein n=1 Tax=Beta vulgaris subsp. vulgaris TaxID=3555 RepID=A0A0J8BDG7_BETVV|nr:hypothetical protein BVRB_4g095480 [Beta vulgaris subsp. vulgaris]